MAKIAKSIRVDENVYSYIVRYKGEGFNEKFENIIRDSMESEVKRKENLKQLDKQIDEKRKQLQKLMDDVTKLQTIQYRVNDILKSCKDIEDKLDIKQESVSHKEPARKIS